MNYNNYQNNVPMAGYQTQNLQNAGLAAFGPSHDECVHSAGHLEATVQKQLAPFKLRVTMAWIAATVGTLAMGAAMYFVLDGVLGWPPVMAIVMALVIQGVAIGLCHMWIHGIWAWNTDTFHSEHPWNWKFGVLLCVALFMIVMAYLRAKLFLEDMELSSFMTAMFSFIIALVDPLVTLALGALTAGASCGLRHPHDLLKRALEHRSAVVGVRGNVWPKSMQQSEKERMDLVNRHLGDDLAISRRNSQVKHIEGWQRLLELHDPGL